MRTDLRKPSKYDRSNPARGLAPGLVGQERIDREGGDRGAGLIRGASIIARGEAMGHGMWIDTEMLEQTAAGINESDNGAKVRFTHPSLSGDGLGTFLGRARDARVEGDQVYADIHFSQAGHRTPDGDLATYTMDLAESDPESFGISIVFQHDFGAEDRFNADHEDEDGAFQSPDPLNTKSLPHARIAKLRGADVVDDPAANPDGLFHRQKEIAGEAEALMAYALGMDDTPPTLTQFDVDPQRISGFVSRFLEQNGLEIKPKETTEMSDEKTDPTETDDQVEPAADDAAQTEDQPADMGDTTDPSEPADTTEPAPADAPQGEGETEAAAGGGEDGGESLAAGDNDRATEGARFIEAFGQQGAVWFAEGKTFDEAQELHNEHLRKRNEELEERNKQLEAQAAEARGGEPIDFAPREDAKPQESAVKRSVRFASSDK